MTLVSSPSKLHSCCFVGHAIPLTDHIVSGICQRLPAVKRRIPRLTTTAVFGGTCTVRKECPVSAIVAHKKLEISTGCHIFQTRACLLVYSVKGPIRNVSDTYVESWLRPSSRNSVSGPFCWRERGLVEAVERACRGASTTRHTLACLDPYLLRPSQIGPVRVKG